MAGMCRHTGRWLEGWDHISQSLDVLLSTRKGTRLERREFGADVPALQDRPADTDTLLDFCVSLAIAIDAYEPRVEFHGIDDVSFDENGTAQISINLTDLTTGQQHIYGTAT